MLPLAPITVGPPGIFVAAVSMVCMQRACEQTQPYIHAVHIVVMLLGVLAALDHHPLELTVHATTGSARLAITLATTLATTPAMPV